MAPHTDDTVSTPEVSIPIKVPPTNGDAQAQTALKRNAEENAAVVSNGEAKPTLEPTHHASPSPPLQLKGVLNQFKSFDVTPVIGKEFPEAKLAEWLRAPNSDELIRDLAITSPPLSPFISNSSTDSCTTSLPARCRLLPRPRRTRRYPPKRARATPRRAFRQACIVYATHSSSHQFKPRRRRRR